jgi:hypothetical protein
VALTRWPSEPNAWLLPWTIWQLRGKVGQRPSSAPYKIPAYAWEFLKWVIWRRKNRPPPRPDIIKIIPKWAYRVLEQVMIAVPLVPPPPPPPPANPDPPDSWHLPYPIMYTSWGWQVDSDWRDTNAGIQRCVEAGINTIALQGGQFNGAQAERCRAAGLKVAVWGSPSSEDANYLTLAGAEGYIPQIESTDEYNRCVVNLTQGVGRGLSIAMVTTLSGLDTYTSRNVGTPQEHPTTVQTGVLATLGCTHAQIECYLGDMSPGNIEQLMFTATRWRGLYYTAPVIGLGGNQAVGEYQPPIDAYGRRFGVYLGEPMRAIDWQAVKGL